MAVDALRALHASIGEAIEDLDRIFKERSTSQPLQFPSLDVPYYPNTPHTEAERLAEQLVADPDVAFVTRRIVAACGQLSATVNKPWLGLMEVVQAGQLTACVRFMEAAHVVEILREAGPGGMHAKDLCRAIIELRPKDALPDPSILTPLRLAHVLRVLATSHWLSEVSANVFTNNRRSAFYDSGKTLELLRSEPEKKYVDTDGSAAMTAVVGDEAFKVLAYLTEWFLPDTRLGSLTVDAKGGFDIPPAEHSTPSRLVVDGENDVLTHYPTAFNLAFDTPAGYFDWIELPENHRRLNRFGNAMTGTCQWESTNEILRGFPWESLPSGAVLVDVGGGIGSTSLTVTQAHPHIQVVVEDRPHVVETAPHSWGPRFAPLFESGRMSWRARDLFAPWEPLASGKVPDVFLIRIVLHDWPDEDCKKILRLLRLAAGPDTKLVIGDMLLPYACAADGAFVPEDSGLLANLGVANIHGYLIDIMMMGLFAANERTVDEMAELALSAGWKVSEVRRVPGSLWAYTTAVPAR